MHNGTEDPIPTCEELHKNEVGLVRGCELDERSAESAGGGGAVRAADVPGTQQTPDRGPFREGQQDA